MTRSLAHNVAASLASGDGLLVGVYDMDVFGEAARSPEGYITVDFLNASTAGGTPSPALVRAIELYRDALPRLCAKHNVSLSAFVELGARYSATPNGGVFVVTVADRAGHRTITEYGGHDGHRTMVPDHEGRLRPKPITRSD